MVTSREKRRLTTMEVSTKAVETIPWESSPKNSRNSAISAKKASTHTLDDELGKKTEMGAGCMCLDCRIICPCLESRP